MRQDVRHPPVGKRLHQSRTADQILCLILRAPVLGEELVIRFDDFRGHQALEQGLDAAANRACRYHQPAPQTGPQAKQAELRSVADHRPLHKGSPS